MFLLLDLATFFDLFHGGKLKEALDTLTKLKLVPMSSNEVDQRVSAFRLLGEDVRRNLPDILVAAMTALHSQYQGMKAKGQVRFHVAFLGIVFLGYMIYYEICSRQVEGLREQAKALITYAGMIPYR